MPKMKTSNRHSKCKSEGIKLINGQTIKEVDAEGYK